MVRIVKRRALSIGINEYKNPDNNLNGCVADSQDFCETMKTLEYLR